MLFHLSHFEMLLLDELLISQNQTHEATHIIIGEAAVDGVIYCRVSCACVGERMQCTPACIWIDLLHVSAQCMALLLGLLFHSVLFLFKLPLFSSSSPFPIALLFSYLFVCLRLFSTRYHTQIFLIFVIVEWTLKSGRAMQRAIKIEWLSLERQWWRGVVYPQKNKNLSLFLCGEGDEIV